MTTNGYEDDQDNFDSNRINNDVADEVRGMDHESINRYLLENSIDARESLSDLLVRIRARSVRRHQVVWARRIMILGASIAIPLIAWSSWPTPSEHTGTTSPNVEVRPVSLIERLVAARNDPEDTQAEQLLYANIPMPTNEADTTLVLEGLNLVFHKTKSERIADPVRASEWLIQCLDHPNQRIRYYAAVFAEAVVSGLYTREELFNKVTSLQKDGPG